MTDARQWQHVFKLDPDKTIDDRTVEAVCESGTDAILVGGTEGVTFENTIDLLGRIRRFETPCVLEVSNASAVVPGFDHYFIPFVMNATDPEWILKQHHEGVKAFGNMIPWQDVSMVGYCVLNPDSAVAGLTKSDTDLDVEDIVAYAQMAALMLRFPFFYMEYSGVYGDVDLLREVRTRLGRETGLHLMYGGGIRQRTQTEDMLSVADTVVVGNVIYEDVQAALDTVPVKRS